MLILSLLQAAPTKKQFLTTSAPHVCYLHPTGPPCAHPLPRIQPTGPTGFFVEELKKKNTLPSIHPKNLQLLFPPSGGVRTQPFWTRFRETEKAGTLAPNPKETPGACEPKPRGYGESPGPDSGTRQRFLAQVLARCRLRCVNRVTVEMKD